jgi:hypothetical protein
LAAAALIAAGQLTITNTSLPTAIIGQPYAQVSLQTSPDPGPLTWSFSSTGPPNFLVVSAPVGQINQLGTFCYGPNSCSGTNAVQTPPGVYKFGIQVTSESTGQTASQELSLVVESPLQILTTFLPNAIANQTYSTQLQSSGGTGNFLWSVVTGPLPPGISLTDAANGVLSGTAPGVNATYPIVVQLLDQVTQEKVTQALAITILNGVVILTSSLPNATLNQPYQFNLVGNGANLVWSVAFGSQLPPGFTLSPAGLLSGTGDSLGAFSFQIQLINGQFPTQIASRIFSFQVALGPLTISESALQAATQNVPYSFTLHAFGGIPPYSWRLGGAIPPGFKIDPTTGVITGTPIQTGSFPLAVTLQDSGNTSVTQNYTLTVGNVLTITNTSLPNGSTNVAYSATLTAVAGQTPYTWSISAGSLPPGLNVDQTTGVISGTPTAAGSYPFTAQVKDSAGVIATKALTITILQPLTITTTSLPGGSLNQPYSQTLAATGGTQPITLWTLTSGSLPAGLNLNQSTGVISGTPTVAGSSTFTIQALDSARGTASQTFTLTIASPQPVIIAVPAGAGSGQQPGIGLSIPAPATGDINGTLNLAFVSSVGGTDNMVRFAPSGSTSITFTIPQGSTTAPNATVITGTVAGTITLTASVPGSPDVIQTIVIAPAVPVISSVVLQQVTGGLNVVVTGYSNTREVSSGTFSFTVSSGNTLSVANLVVPLTSAYATWFNNTSSNATGGQFKLTVPFSVTQGSAIAVTRVSVTLTNVQGASAAVSSQ